MHIGILSGALTVAIAVLLVTHAFFALTSQTSVESATLMENNPFFESNLSEEANRDYVSTQ